MNSAERDGHLFRLYFYHNQKMERLRAEMDKEVESYWKKVNEICDAYEHDKIKGEDYDSQ